MRATFSFEFLSRGLTWSRLLLIALLVPDENYALIVLLVTAEGLLGELIAYPQIREILRSRGVNGEAVWSGLLLWAITSPIQYIGSLTYFGSHTAALVVLICSLTFCLTQILIYLLRVIDLRSHNTAKLISAASSTALFFALVPIDPYFYVIAAIGAPVAPAALIARRKGAAFFTPAGPKLSKIWRGWLHFGMQAMSAVLWQYGNRFVAGYLFATSVVSTFMRGYLLASGVIFVYSAAMIVWERAISTEIAPNELKARIQEAARVFGILSVFWVCYVAAVVTLFVHPLVEVPYVNALGEGVDAELFYAFFAIFLVRALQLTTSPVMIALGRAGIVSVASVASICVQVGLFWMFWDRMTAFSVALVMLASLLVSVAIVSGTILAELYRNRIARTRPDAVEMPQRERG